RRDGRRVRAARGTAQLDRLVSQTSRREEGQRRRRRAEAAGLDDRGGVRCAEGFHDPHRTHGRPYCRGARRAAAADRAGARVTPTWRVVVADRVAKSGLELLSNTPDIEVVDVAGKPAE